MRGGFRVFGSELQKLKRYRDNATTSPNAVGARRRKDTDNTDEGTVKRQQR